MALDHSLIGVPGEPQERSWTSADALLYAIGVGAGLGEPLHELEFTTEYSAGVEQQVLPTFGVLVAQARTGRRLGTFDRARLVHAEQAFELRRPLPVAGTARVTARFGFMSGRFSHPALPGQTLVTSIWQDDAGAVFQTAKPDGTVVIDRDRMRIRTLSFDGTVRGSCPRYLVYQQVLVFCRTSV
jgi:hypothetical protein